MGFKGFVRGFGRVVRDNAPVALGVAAAVTPAGRVRNAVQLTRTVVNAIEYARMSGKKGEEAFEEAMSALSVSAPMIIDELEQVFGVEVDEAAAERYMRGQVQLVYDLLKSGKGVTAAAVVENLTVDPTLAQTLARENQLGRWENGKFIVQHDDVVREEFTTTGYDPRNGLAPAAGSHLDGDMRMWNPSNLSNSSTADRPALEKAQEESNRLFDAMGPGSRDALLSVARRYNLDTSEEGLQELAARIKREKILL